MTITEERLRKELASFVKNVTEATSFEGELNALTDATMRYRRFLLRRCTSDIDRKLVDRIDGDLAGSLGMSEAP